MPDKFEELAAGIEQDLANWDQQADELMTIRETNRKRGELVFARHRDKQSAVKAGLDRMEKALASLEGSNSKNEEGSGASSDTFQRSGDDQKQA